MSGGWLSAVVLGLALGLSVANAEPADAGTAAPEPLQVHAEVQPPEVKLGVPFTYDVTLVHPADQRYEWAPPVSQGPIEVLSHTREPVPADGGGPASTHFKIQMAVFELGVHALPDLTFEVAHDGKTTHWVLPGAQVKGLSSLPADADQAGAQLQDIKPPDAVWIRSYRILAWGLVAILAAITAFFFVRWLRQRPRKAVPVPPPDPIDVRTLRALDELAKQELPRQGRAREYYFLLAEILRGYLGERYGVDALECTSGELIQRLRGVPDPRLPRVELRAFLEEADLVKFARATADPAACAKALQFGHLLVRETAPPVVSANVPGNHLPAA